MIGCKDLGIFLTFLENQEILQEQVEGTFIETHNWIRQGRIYLRLNVALEKNLRFTYQYGEVSGTQAHNFSLGIQRTLELRKRGRVALDHEGINLVFIDSSEIRVQDRDLYSRLVQARDQVRIT